VDFFQTLEMQLASQNPPLAGRDHLIYRSYYVPVKGVIDGDLCETFFLLANDKKQTIAGELDRSVREVERKISVCFRPSSMRKVHTNRCRICVHELPIDLRGCGKVCWLHQAGTRGGTGCIDARGCAMQDTLSCLQLKEINASKRCDGGLLLLRFEQCAPLI
jgi:CPSF A subunit region